MRVGAMRHKISLLQSINTKDAYGCDQHLGSTYASNVWASVEYLANVEDRNAADGGTRFRQRALFKIRYSTAVKNVTNAYAVWHNSLNWNIVSVDNTANMNKELVIMAELGMTASGY